MTFIQLSTIQYQKEISYQTINISEGLLNAYYQVKEASLKVIQCMVTAIGHSGKGETIATVERSQVASGQEEKAGGTGGTRRILQAVKQLPLTLSAKAHGIDNT